MMQHTYSNPTNYKELVIRVCNEYGHHVEQEDGLWYIVHYTGKRWIEYYPDKRDLYVYDDELEAYAYCLYLALHDLF